MAMDSKADGINDVFIMERKNFLNFGGFKESFENYLGLELLHEKKIGSYIQYVINRARIRDVAAYMKRAGFMLEHIAATDKIDSFEINYVYSCSRFIPNSHIFIQSSISKKLNPPSISDIFKNARVFERRLFHRKGITFIEQTRAESGEKIGMKGEKVHLKGPLEIYPVHGLKTPFKYGIFHPVHLSDHYLEVYSEKGRIKEIELRDGWLYKNIARAMEMVSFPEGYSTILENLHEHDYVALHLSICTAFEQILSKKIPNKVKYIRILLAELERIQHHLIWFFNLAYLLHNRAAAGKILKEILKLEEKITELFHNPYMFRTIKLGTVTDADMRIARNFWIFLKENGEKLFDLVYEFLYNQQISDALEGKGIIPRKIAEDFGLSGPSLRGSGIQSDARMTESFLPYTAGDISQIWNVISFKGEDAFARAQVMLWEIRESLTIAVYLLKNLSYYERKAPFEPLDPNAKLPKNKEGYAIFESPRGKIETYIRTHPDEDSPNIYGISISSAEPLKFAVLETVLENQKLKDVPVIIHSLDINFNLLDL